MKAKKLLVADDSLTIQKVIRLALSNEGYEIQAVSDGNDAVQQISLFRPDVVLIDVSLPGQSAFEVKRAINEHADLEDVRFVLMSSAFEKVDEPQADEVKFHGRLTKPFDPAHLRDVLNQALAQAMSRRLEPASLLTRPGLSPSQDAPPFPPLPGFDPPAPTFEPPFNGEMPGGSVDDQAEEISADSDIRQLTESTIRMSGLDDFNWNIQEPSLKPPAGVQDSGETTFHFEAPETGPASAYHDAPDEIPNHNTFTPSSISLDTQVEMQAPPPPPIQLPEVESHQHSSIPSPVENSAAPSRPSITDQEIEELVSQKVEESLRQMVKTLLPQIAERVIKAEIHRLLSERP